MKFFCWLIIFISFASLLVAQQQDSINTTTTQQDSLVVEQASIIKKKKKPKYYPNHSPRKALLYGLIPGGGQVYNRKYWKLPIVYAGVGGLGYWVYYNRSNYQCYRRSYLNVNDLDSTTVNTCDPTLTDAQLKLLRDQYQQQYEYSILAFIGFYGLTLMDAFVDAHLMNFDISDDLSLDIQPDLNFNAWANRGQRLNASLNFRFRLKANSPKVYPLNF